MRVFLSPMQSWAFLLLEIGCLLVGLGAAVWLLTHPLEDDE